MSGRVSSRAIVGREGPLAELAGVLAAALRGEASMALLAGEAGIGKSRLAAALEARASEQGAVVLHGECVDFGGDDLGYAPVVAALRDLPEAWAAEALDALPDGARADLARLLPAIEAPRTAAPLGAAHGAARLCELVLGLLRGLAREVAPALLVLEDMHWADRSSRELIAFLARNLRADHIAIVLTYRTEELPAGHALRRLAAELARRPAVTHIVLRPLGRDDVRRQLEAIAGGPVAAALADHVHARAGGNPFLAEELFAAARDGSGGQVPASVADAVLARVERLAPETQRLLDAVAVAGGRAEYALLERVAPGPADALRAALDACLLVRDPGDTGVAFRHGLIGEVVYERLLPGERTALHRAIAGALEGPPGRLAHHWQIAGALPEALDASLVAGADAEAVYGFAEADRHYTRALALWDAVAPAAPALDRVEVLARAAQAARFSGDAERAAALCREALDRLDHAAEPVRAARLYERLGEYRFWDDEAALECFAAALRLLEPDEAEERARLLAARGHALMGLHRWEEARAACESSLARHAAASEADARTTLGLVLGFLGEPAEGETQLRRALVAAAERGQAESLVRAHMHLAELLRLRGDRAGALEVSLAGEAEAARLGMTGSFGHFLAVNAVDDLVRLGRFSEAATRLEAARRMDLGPTAAVLRLTLAGELQALRGEPAADETLAAARHLASGLPREFLVPLHTAMATLALAEGDPQRARGHAAAGFAAEDGAPDRFCAGDPLYTPALLVAAARAEAELAERARGLRRPADAETAAARAARLLAALDAIRARAPGAWPEVEAHRALAAAELARAAGRGEAGGWAAAAATWEALGGIHPAGYARVREAEAHLLVGARGAAAGPLRAAHDAAEALDARPLREEVERLARRARLPLATVPDAPSPAAGPLAELGLTARETEVLKLIADGLTNREIATRLFISQKTVAAHVEHIFRKLDVHSRVAAAGRAQRLGVAS